MPTPSNGLNLPNYAPFTCAFDPDLGAVVQVASPQVEQALEKAYRLGALIGTPLNDDPAGKKYVEDFLAFISHHGPRPHGRCLEVGAGVGYLTRRLKDLGWDAVGVEPGIGYQEEQRRHGAKVVQEAFPSNAAPGPFDLIVSFAVLEHLSDPIGMLSMMREHLMPDGAIIVAVPDCSDEIRAGDPAILIHEHMTYFTPGSLCNVLERAGLQANAFTSTYGRSLYAVARPGSGTPDPPKKIDVDLSQAMTFPARAGEAISSLQQLLRSLAKSGSLGLYAPARGLALYEPPWQARFFDDDPQLQRRYYPPFAPPVEDRASLLAQPVDDLVILSRTFGKKVQRELREAGYVGRIRLLQDLFP